MPKDGHKLLSVERERLILKLLGKGYTTITELSSRIDVSEATIRRDLLSLEETKKIRRVHGGAVKVKNVETEPIFIEKASRNAESKEHIANLALSLIEDSDVIYLDGGSTIQELAKLLVRKKDLTIVTNSLMAAVELFETEHRLIIVGGEFRKLSRTVVGSLTEKMLSSVNIDKAFLGTIGFSASKGMSTTDPNEAFTKELVMKNANKVFVLADSSKIGVESFAKSGELSYMNALITDAELDADFAAQLTQNNVELIN